MTKKVDLFTPQALNDFYKSNGSNTVVYNDGPSLTRQEFAEECDINSIMARYERTGAIPNLAEVQPIYVDFTELPSGLMDTMERLADAEHAFMRLPAKVRKEFDNSPYAFVDFASDRGNIDQMRSWGLAPPAAPKPAEPGSPAPAPAAAPAAGASPGGSQAAPHTST